MELKFVGKSAWKIDNFNSTNLNFGLLNVQKKSILLNIKIKLSFQKGCAEHYLTFEIREIDTSTSFTKFIPSNCKILKIENTTIFNSKMNFVFAIITLIIYNHSFPK